MIQQPEHGVRRHGVILIAVIVCLMIASALLLSTVGSAAARFRATQFQLWRVQAEWLADSAVQRTAARLAADADYKGETWRLTSEHLGGKDGASVHIEVEAVADEPARRLVRVEADYPDDPQQRASHNTEVVVELRSPKGRRGQSD